MKKTLEDKIDRFLNSLPNSPSKDLVSSTTDNLYEAYIYVLVAKAFLNDGWDLTHFNINQVTSPAEFVFRTSPGKIWSKHRAYSYLVASKDNRSYEVHMGVEIEGKSGIESEIDISVILHQAAEEARNKPREKQVKSIHVPIVIECKCYTSYLNKSLGREFLGLVKDFSAPKNGLRIMATNLNDNLPVAMMIRHHGFKFSGNLTPLSSKVRVSSFLGYISERLPNLK